MTNNETIREFTIKRRGDGVYDVYLDDVYICSKGSFKSVIKELESIMVEADEYKLNETK